MFLTPIMIRAIQQKDDVEATLKDCHKNVVVLRQQIRILQAEAEKKVCAELKENSLCKKVSDICHQLDSSVKSVQALYSHWHYICNEMSEGWDCDYYDEEIEKLVKPLEKLVEQARDESASVRDKIVEPIHNKYYVEIDKLNKTLAELEKKEKKLRCLFSESYGVMCTALKPILKVFEHLFAAGFKEIGLGDDERTPFITPCRDGSKGWKLIFSYQECLRYSDEIDKEDFDDTASDIKNGLCSRIEDLKDSLINYCSDHIPGGVDEVVLEYDENDIEIDGNRYHHKGYYEKDTGYGESAGEFYYGKVTASTSVNILVRVS